MLATVSPTVLRYSSPANCPPCTLCCSSAVPCLGASWLALAEWEWEEEELEELEELEEEVEAVALAFGPCWPDQAVQIPRMTLARWSEAYCVAK